MSDPISLTLERLDRLERSLAGLSAQVDKRFDKVDNRFDGIESALGKMVNVLEAHDVRLEEIVGRLDRLMAQTIRARTEDAERLDSLQRRLTELEERERP